ncbi:MFS transporter [Rhodovarius crocodyli]|nr:MFS transporter [Rhodovarius crocodyli]
MADIDDARAEDRRIRKLIAVFAISAFAASMVARATDPLVLAISREFLVPEATVALLGSAFALPYALVQPFLGPIGDALGKKRIILLCQFLVALMVLGCAISPAFLPLLLMRALSGAAAGGTMPLTLAVFGDEVPAAKRQVAISRLLMFTICGQIGGGITSAILEPLLGWRGVLLLCAGLTFTAVIIMFMARRRAPAEPMQPFRPGEAMRRYATILRLPQARVLYPAVALEGALIFGAFPHLAPILQSRGLGGTQEAGLALSCFGAGGFFYGLIVTWLLRYLGQAWMVRLGGLMGFLALVGFALAPSTPLFVASGLALGLGFFLMHNTLQVRVLELAPTSRGSAIALHAFGFFSGQSLGAALTGLGASAIGYVPCLIASGLCLLALGVWVGHTPKRA